MTTDKSSSEAERLAIMHIKSTQAINKIVAEAFISGFHAGERSERVMGLVEALKFYADPSNYHHDETYDGLLIKTIGEDNPGHIAKSALAAFEQE